MRAIYKRELASYWNNMIGAVCAAFMMAVVGLYFIAYNLFSGYPSFATALSASLFLFMVDIPILTMRSMAEDRHSRTDQLLLTAPVSVTKIVLGKFLALWTVFAVPCGVFCLCPLVMKLSAGSTGTVYFLTDYATILAFFLLGGLYLSIGVLISSTTESQMLSAVGTFAILFVLFMWDGLMSLLPTGAMANLVGCVLLLIGLCLLLDTLLNDWRISGAVGAVGCVALAVTYAVKSSLFSSLLKNVLGKFNLGEVIDSFASDQMFDWSGLLLYASLTALCLFLTVQVIQRRRWN